MATTAFYQKLPNCAHITSMNERCICEFRGVPEFRVPPNMTYRKSQYSVTLSVPWPGQGRTKTNKQTKNRCGGVLRFGLVGDVPLVYINIRSAHSNLSFTHHFVIYSWLQNV